MGQLHTDIALFRFECQRLNPDVPEGTHLTFSILPYPLIPYSAWGIDISLEIAETLAGQEGNAYHTNNILAEIYQQAMPEMDAVRRIGRTIQQALDKLDQVALANTSIDWRPSTSPYPERLADFSRFAKGYHSESLQVRGICALCNDYFYIFQQDLPYMQRDFLFGTPSQQYL